MRRLFLLLLSIIPFVTNGQSKTTLKKEIVQLENTIELYKGSIYYLKYENEQYKNQIDDIVKCVNEYPKSIAIPHQRPDKQRSTNDRISSQQPISHSSYNDKPYYTSSRCEAITQKGTRCKRSAKDGSKYCWQHQNYQSKTSSSSYYNSGHIWHTGPRGGQYYINSKGNKVYRKRK